MAKIFISYRRVDSNAITSRIYDRFAAAFGKNDIFKDVDNIPLGRDFRGVLREATAQCQVMIVVIGPDWVDAKDASGNRRLDNPDDFVRIEVETGLQRDEIVVIPLLVEGAHMPSPTELPDSMRELVYNNAFIVHDDPLFHRDMDSLIASVRGQLGRKGLTTRWLALAATLLVVGVIAGVLLLARSNGGGSAGLPTNTLTVSPGQQSVVDNLTDTPDFTAQAQTQTAVLGTPIRLTNTTSILPDFNALHDSLRSLYANGINNFGNRATVFARAGDSIFITSEILSPFSKKSGQFNLGSHTELQAIIGWYNATDLDGATSFNQNSLALDPGWKVQDLLDPKRAESLCNGAAPLICELQQVHPSIMFVAIGTNDAEKGTSPAAFSNTLNQIVSIIISNGTIPILLTIPDNGKIPATEAINEAIITVAQQNHLPLLNAARAFRELPNFNLFAAPAGAGALDYTSISQYGLNLLNLDLLNVLSEARNIIFPDA